MKTTRLSYALACALGLSCPASAVAPALDPGAFKTLKELGKGRDASAPSLGPVQEVRLTYNPDVYGPFSEITALAVRFGEPIWDGNAIIAYAFNLFSQNLALSNALFVVALEQLAVTPDAETMRAREDLSVQSVQFIMVLEGPNSYSLYFDRMNGREVIRFRLTPSGLLYDKEIMYMGPTAKGTITKTPELMLLLRYEMEFVKSVGSYLNEYHKAHPEITNAVEFRKRLMIQR
jgi:hypothetical protein